MDHSYEEIRAAALRCPSARVLDKAGYRCEGILRQSAIKDGQVMDQRMYAILRDDLIAPRVGGG